MFTSAKAFWVICGLYLLTIFLPAVILAIAPTAASLHYYFPAEIIHRMLIACAVFLGGLAVGAVAFRFSSHEGSPAAFEAFEHGLVALVAITTVIAAYVLVAGPPAPFFAAFVLTDPDAILYVREDALKLNPDILFVRLYSWGRDIFAPVAFVLSVHALRHGKGKRLRLVAIVGLVVAVYLGLWSGHKATLVNYLLAAFIFTSRNVRTMGLAAAKATPLLLALVAVLFWITLPQLVDNPDAAQILFTSISNRLLFAPFEVAASYIDAVDRLHAITAADALPYVDFLWTPGIVSLENQIGLQYFTPNLESSIHANGAAFAYAYVLGGYIGAFVAGLVIMAGLRIAMGISAATGSSFLGAAFSASLCYMLLDLMNANFVSYLLKIIVLSILMWGAHGLAPRRTLRQLEASPSRS